MAFIGIMLFLSIIGTLAGITGVILTSVLSIWGKIALLSVEVLIFSVILAAWNTKNEEEENE